MTDVAADLERRGEGIAAVVMGGVIMTAVGVQSMILGGLAQAGHFPTSAALIGPLAELGVMGLTVAVAGTCLPPRRLRLVAGLAAAAYALLALGSAVVTGEGVIALRALAGVASGLLVWITIGFLARREHPEPWAVGFFACQATGSLAFAAILAVLVMPGFGGVGGEAAVALLVLTIVPIAIGAAPAYSTLERGPLPSGRGLIGLLALLLYLTASAGVWYQTRDFARAAGLGEAAGGYGMLANLAGQFAGAALALALARRARFVTVFAAVCVLTLGAWAGLVMGASMAPHLAAVALAGLASMLLATGLFSFLAEAEPSRRAAAVSASAQLFGAVLGPVLRAPLAVDVALVLASFALVAWLARPQRMALAAGRP